MFSSTSVSAASASSTPSSDSTFRISKVLGARYKGDCSDDKEYFVRRAGGRKTWGRKADIWISESIIPSESAQEIENQFANVKLQLMQHALATFVADASVSSILTVDCDGLRSSLGDEFGSATEFVLASEETIRRCTFVRQVDGTFGPITLDQPVPTSFSAAIVASMVPFVGKFGSFEAFMSFLHLLQVSCVTSGVISLLGPVDPQRRRSKPLDWTNDQLISEVMSESAEENYHITVLQSAIGPNMDFHSVIFRAERFNEDEIAQKLEELTVAQDADAEMKAAADLTGSGSDDEENEDDESDDDSFSEDEDEDEDGEDDESSSSEEEEQEDTVAAASAAMTQ